VSSATISNVRIVLGLVGAVLFISLVTLIALSVGANATTVGFAYLILILGISLFGGLTVGLLSSVVATACFNYFFLPPVHTWVIADPANWVALISFFVASVVASRLVVRRQEVERLVALRESDALKTSLLRAVSHDLSTPLTAITMQIERLQRQVDPSMVAELAEQTDRLRRRIENLLAMARLEAGTFLPRPEPTPPADLFRAVREHLPLVTNLRVSVSDDCPDVYADPSLTLEVLVNLVENAHRASPLGSTIELLAHPAGARVRLEVLDRGSGIAETESDTAHRGLGLEIARSFAAANGGDVSLANRPGGGAIALIDLPVART
jgi:two-component system sensor histidine kinase KdpD